jgi:hypothetical protein
MISEGIGHGVVKALAIDAGQTSEYLLYFGIVGQSNKSGIPRKPIQDIDEIFDVVPLAHIGAAVPG